MRFGRRRARSRPAPRLVRHPARRNFTSGLYLALEPGALQSSGQIGRERRLHIHPFVPEGVREGESAGVEELTIELELAGTAVDGATNGAAGAHGPRSG